ncbi:MAG: PQQ-dependent sugar dehydrogenase [Steroidobacteraceae bacterium]
MFVFVHRPVPGALGAGASALILVAALGGHAIYRAGWLPRPAQPSVQTRRYDSSLYLLDITTYSNWIPAPQFSGGGIARWEDGLLFATGGGELFVVRGIGDATGLRINRLAYPIPLNIEDFKRGATELLKNTRGKTADYKRFRVTGILTVQTGNHITLYASHHYWDSANHCFALRVSTLSAENAALEAGTADAGWHTVFQSSPCLNLTINGVKGKPFEGWESGGRMALINDHELLLTVGDHGFDGVDRLPALPQDMASSYGKIMLIPLNGGTPTLFSSGHRNPQGLLVTADGTIWSTEHGPRGGDELNHIVNGANYGWPLVTLGVDYGNRIWPLNDKPGRHEGYVPPIYAFVPSVGISNLITAPEQLFPAWAGDLLVGSLAKETLFRIRLLNGNVQFSEPIFIGDRIRDLTSTHAGVVVIWTDDGNIITVKPRDESKAEKLLTACTACHSMNENDPSSTAPNLYGLINRRVASRSDFGYSAAMKSFGGRWTRQRLDLFLTHPQNVVPGTIMQYPGIANADDRETIIDFLENPPN